MNWPAKIVEPMQRAASSFLQKTGFASRAFLTGSDADDRSASRLTDPYARSVWVMAAIKKVVEPLASVTLNFSEDKRRGERLVQDPAFLAFWRQPVVGLNAAEFITATASWYELTGEAFFILDESWAARFSGKRNPMVMVRPDRMRHIVRNGVLEGWEYTDAAGRRNYLVPQEVKQIKSFNPYCPWRGLAPWEAAKVAAQADYMAGMLNLDLMINNGAQGNIIAAKGGVPSDPQREQITQALRERQAARRAGRHLDIFLSGDVSIEDPKVQALDAAFVAVRLENRHEIAAAFGVPMSMFDIKASYSVGSASDRYMLIEETCMPLGERLCDTFETIAQLWFAGRTAPIYGWLNWTEHSVIQTARRERLKEADGLWAKGMPMKDVSVYLDLALPRFDGDDVGYLPFSVSQVGESVAPAKDPALAESEAAPAKDDPIGAMVRFLECPAHGKAQHGTKARDKRRVALWEKHMQDRKEIDENFRAKLRKVLFKARAECLAKLDAQKSLTTKAVAADFLFDLEDFEEGITAEMRKVSRAALEKAGEQLFDEVGKDDPFTMPPARALSFLNERANLMSSVADEVYNDIKATIQQSIEAGDSTAQIANAIREKFNDMTKGRALTVAGTETSAAYGVARDEAMKQADVQFKQWLTSGNDNVRDSHLAIDGEVVPLDEKFGNGLAFPGDPEGDAAEVINCRCVQIAVANAEGKLFT